jgi:hypothetical protein
MAFSQPQNSDNGRENDAYFPDGNDVAHFGDLHSEQDDQIGKI